MVCFRRAAVIAVMVALATLSGAETVERIAAVVGDRVILASEVATQVQMAMIQIGQESGLDPNQLARDILEQMVNDELILSAAKGDTTITVSDAEVRAEMDQRIAALAARFPSEEAFLAQLQREGWTKRSYEKRLHTQIRDQLLKQKTINTRLAKVSVSRQEAETFFATYADSLPEMSPRIRLAHILISFAVSPRTDDSVRQLADEARGLIAGGMSFADAAAKFGDGVVGGNIGFIRREEVVPEFGRTAFNLQPGSVSGPVRTEYGWHIIKSHQRAGDSVEVSQILFPMIPSAADSTRTRTLADSLYQALKGGADFRELAKQFSDDSTSRAVGGELDMMDATQLRPEFVEPLAAVDTGHITPPVESQMGFHILKLLERTPGRPLDLNTDFDTIREMARRQKTSRLVEQWVNELKKKTYVDIRSLDGT